MGSRIGALRHRVDKPDFHAAEGFALLLEPPDPGGRSSNARVKMKIDEAPPTTRS